MAAASIRVANAQIAAEEESIKRLYPQYTALQFQTADQLAGKLNNEYLARTRGVVGEELRAASAPSAIEAELQKRGLGDLRAGPTAIQRQLRDDAQRDLAAGPTAIESKLLTDAERELALGRSLSAEEMRDAAQSARGAFAARGLATGLGSTAAEILNRDSFGRQREAERRQFAVGAEQYARQGTMARRGAAQDAEQYFLGAEDARRGFAANVNQMDLARRQRRIGLGGMYMEMDPYRQALGPAFGLGGDTLRTSQGQVSNIFNNSLTQSGNVASFNTNMLASNRNAVLNNNAAMQAAAMQSGAMGQSGMMGMMGGIGGGLLTGAGLAL
jgi:hypothetical protein